MRWNIMDQWKRIHTPFVSPFYECFGRSNEGEIEEISKYRKLCRAWRKFCAITAYRHVSTSNNHHESEDYSEVWGHS